MSKIKRIGSVVAIALLTLTISSPLLAGKGGKGKPGGGGGDDGGGGDAPAGVVYFQLNGQYQTMNADGSAKTAVPANVAGEPSHALHGGPRWLLDVRFVAGVYPDGTARRELFAVRDDGNEAFTVQLTNDPQLKLLEETGRHLSRWSLDAGDFADPNDDVTDGLASWRAVGFDGNGEPDASKSGIYAISVAFDGDGNVDPLPVDLRLVAPELVIPSGVIDDPQFGAMPDIISHDWSPDGQFVVYRQWVNAGNPEELRIADATTGFSIFLAGDGRDPQWSPDGSKIAFWSVDTLGSGSFAIETIHPDGTNRLVVTSVKTKRANKVVRWPNWSPTGTHLTYQYFEFGRRNNDDVYRVGVGGDGNTNLTADTTAVAAPVAWRD